MHLFEGTIEGGQGREARLVSDLLVAHFGRLQQDLRLGDPKRLQLIPEGFPALFLAEPINVFL